MKLTGLVGHHILRVVDENALVHPLTVSADKLIANVCFERSTAGQRRSFQSDKRTHPSAYHCKSRFDKLEEFLLWMFVVSLVGRAGMYARTPKTPTSSQTRRAVGSILQKLAGTILRRWALVNNNVWRGRRPAANVVFSIEMQCRPPAVPKPRPQFRMPAGIEMRSMHGTM